MDSALIDTLHVYPPLGIARVGNAPGPDDFIVGPEVIGGPPTLPDGTAARALGDFRTADGRIKRQAARFRIYARLKDGTAREVTGADARIEILVQRMVGLAQQVAEVAVDEARAAHSGCSV